MRQVITPVRIAQVRLYSSLASMSAIGTRQARSFSTRFDHQAWQSANSSKRIGFVFEYFLRPSGGGIW